MIADIELKEPSLKLLELRHTVDFQPRLFIGRGTQNTFKIDVSLVIPPKKSILY